MSEEKIVL